MDAAEQLPYLEDHLIWNDIIFPFNWESKVTMVPIICN